MAHVPQQCDQCGATDDHPKIHFGGGRTVHHDCMSTDEREQALGSNQGSHISKIVKKAESGVHGEDLRGFIRESVGKG